MRIDDFSGRVDGVNHSISAIIGDFKEKHELVEGLKYRVTTADRWFDGFFKVVRPHYGHHFGVNVYCEFYKVKNDSSPSIATTGEFIREIISIDICPF